MQTRHHLDRLFTALLLLALPFSTAIAMAAPDDDEEKHAEKRIVIDLNVNGEKYHITNLDELKEHADKIKEHVDIDGLMEAFDGDGGKARIRILGHDGGDMDVDVVKKMLKLKGAEGNVFRFPGGAWVTDGEDVQKALNHKVGDYMIGLSCKVADDTLCKQLQLDSGALVVIAPMEGTPAEEAGFETHDVLVSADGESLTDLITLIKSVEKAGKEDREVEVVVLRGGEKQAIKVKPGERPDSAQFRIEVDSKVDWVADEEVTRDDDDDDDADELRKMIDELRREVKRMKKQLKDRD